MPMCDRDKYTVKCFFATKEARVTGISGHSALGGETIGIGEDWAESVLWVNRTAVRQGHVNMQTQCCLIVSHSFFFIFFEISLQSRDLLIYF